MIRTQSECYQYFVFQRFHQHFLSASSYLFIQEIIVAGNQLEDTAITEVFSLQSQSWSSGPVLPTPTRAMTAVQRSPDQILMIGGENPETGKHLTTVLEYIPDDPSWSVIGTLDIARKFPAAVMIDGQGKCG